MEKKVFRKLLKSNDVGTTGSHQSGIHIPKSQKELISFLPDLDYSIKNPSLFFKCIDDDNLEWKFRYIYYNNKFHDEKGTRDEFRITQINSFFKSKLAEKNDIFEISKYINKKYYNVQILKSNHQDISNKPIKLKGWNKVY